MRKLIVSRWEPGALFELVLFKITPNSFFYFTNLQKSTPHYFYLLKNCNCHNLWTMSNTQFIKLCVTHSPWIITVNGLSKSIHKPILWSLLCVFLWACRCVSVCTCADLKLIFDSCWLPGCNARFQKWVVLFCFPGLRERDGPRLPSWFVPKVGLVLTVSQFLVLYLNH